MTPVQYFHIAQSLIKEHFKHLFVLTKQICKYPVKFLCLVAAFSLIYIATLLPAERDSTATITIQKSAEHSWSNKRVLTIPGSKLYFLPCKLSSVALFKSSSSLIS